MSDDYKFGLSDLALSDDLDVSMDNDTYEDQANPAPPVAGNYLVRALTLDAATKKTGELILEDDKFPIFRLGMIEIVEGLVDATGNPVSRKVGIFHDVKTKPFQRQGGGVASGIGDLTRAYGTRSWSGLDPENPESGISVLKEAFEQQATFAIALDWEAYDKAFIDAAFEQLSLKTGKELYASGEKREDAEKKLVNAIYNAGRVKGMRFFPFDSDRGKFLGVLARENVTFKNPMTNGLTTVEVDHRSLEAKPVITRFYPHKDVEAGRVKFGPSKAKPAALVAA